MDFEGNPVEVQRGRSSGGAADQQEAAEQAQQEEAAAPIISRRRRAELVKASRANRVEQQRRDRRAEREAEQEGWRKSLANMPGSATTDTDPPLWSELAVRPDRSHALRYVGGIWFCRSCGGTHAGGASVLERLPHRCYKQKPAGGSLSRLRRLKQGLLPRTHQMWPDSVGGTSQRIVQDVSRAATSRAGRDE